MTLTQMTFLRHAWSRACLATAALLAACLAHADETLWTKLREGGYAVMIRHAATEPGVGDPPNFVIGDCRTQRNLSDGGREASRRLGVAFRVNKVPVTRVLSSAWCRCQDTARLAFAKYEVWAPLNSFFGNRSTENDQTHAVWALVSTIRPGENVVLVTHQVNITAATGVYPTPGEMVLLRPTAEGKIEVAGRMPVPD
jgi:phosphohistidine phosphatase SixA